MSALLKDFYSPQRIHRIADTLKKYHPELNHSSFIHTVLDESWPDLELKQRQYQLSSALFHHFPQDYPTSLKLLCNASREFSASHNKPLPSTQKEDLGNFEYMFFPGVIEYFGSEKDEYWQDNMQALSLFTQYSSSEFAVRPFILKQPRKMMKQMLAWSKHENYHVRRLASEGCRPSLPWATALTPFHENPEPILPILHTLKDDPSLYVRRSVANNLNDISKNHPDLVLMLATKWLGKSKETDWLVKHGLRTLLKQGNSRALALFGFYQPKHIACSRIECETKISLGETLNFSACLSTTNNQLGKCRLEFAIDFIKSRNKVSRKVFKISEGVINAPTKHIGKSFSFKPISTRRYYPGVHQLHLLVNGHIVQSKKFMLRGND